MMSVQIAPLVRDEEQTTLWESAVAFAGERAPLAYGRARRGQPCEVGLWAEMCELGWGAIPFAEAHDGLGLGHVELGLVLEALGRTLAPTPLFASVSLFGRALQVSGNTELQARWIPGLATGEVLGALAWRERGMRHDLSKTCVQAQRSGDGWRLTGEKVGVADGSVAHRWMVSARTSGSRGDRDGITLFLVDPRAASCRRNERIDHRSVATLQLQDTAAEAVLGEVGGGLALLESTLDHATVDLCAEMLGGMQAAFDATLDWLKEREQFGRPIGSFQALQHRAARTYVAVELARSTVMAAARVADTAGGDALAEAASLAKATCNDAYLRTANQAIQMFGGIGMTDECDIGTYLKHARVCSMMLGDTTWHRGRWASLRGY
jgi:alkylation response protein AidB-like acyl-CoA dehydrogenase